MARVSAKTAAPTAEEELALLRAENAELKAKLEAPPVEPTRHRGSIWRGILGFLLIFLGVVLAPVAVLSAWAAAEVSDTERFVASIAPIIEDEDVRAYLSTEITDAVVDGVDIDGLTSQVFDGIAGLENLPPRVASALALLEPAAANGMKNLIETQVTRLVNSDAFATVWEESLRLSHAQMVAVLTNDPDSAIVISDDGQVGIQLAPLLEKVKERLVASDFPLANQIPVVDAIIPIAEAENIAAIRTAYNTLVTIGAVLPWISLLLIAAGILVARNRARATMSAGIGLAIVSLALLLTLAIARTLVSTALATSGVPTDVARTIFDTLTATLQATSVAVVVLGIAIAIGGFVTGSSRAAVGARSGVNRVLTNSRDGLDRAGLSSPSVGAWLYRARGFIWAAVLVIAVLVALSVRPLQPWVIIVTALVALAVLFVIALFERPPTVELVVSPAE